MKDGYRDTMSIRRLSNFVSAVGQAVLRRTES